MFTSPTGSGDAPAIAVTGLRKSYGELEAVRGVSFEVARGEVFCLLGPNGAGKTSVVEVLEGYRRADGGQARVLGFDPAQAPRAMRERVGIVLQECGVQPDLSVAELLEMYGRYYARRRPVDEVLALVELGEKRDARAANLSGGQRRRLDLGLALIGDPELIFLDEPTTGFDPAARRAAWSTIRSLCRLGKTVLLTTHFMDEAQALADRIAVMRAGEVIAAGTPDEIGGRDRRPAEIRFTLPVGMTIDDLPAVPSELRAADPPSAGAAAGGGERVLVLTREPIAAAHAITGWALDRDLTLAGFAVSQPTLEDIYLELTGSPAAAAEGATTNDREEARR